LNVKGMQQPGRFRYKLSEDCDIDSLVLNDLHKYVINAVSSGIPEKKFQYLLRIIL